MNYPTRKEIEREMEKPDYTFEEIEKFNGIQYKATQNIIKMISPLLLAMHDVIDSQQAQIDRLKTSHDFWKSTAINLDGKYQNWIE